MARKPGEAVGQVGRRHQAIHVGADRKEGHEAQVQQAGIAHHDVQAQGQQHVQQRHVGDAHPGVARGLQHQRQDQQRQRARPGKTEDLFFCMGVLLQARSATRSPSKPEGRSVSMMISTMKAKMSE
jgi:hypothetical protein